MTPKQRKSVRALLVAFDDASAKAMRKRNKRAEETIIVVARFGGEALHFLRSMLAEEEIEETPAHKQEGTQAEFDRYIAGDR